MIRKLLPLPSVFLAILLLLTCVNAHAQSSGKSKKAKETPSDNPKKSPNRTLYGQASFYAAKFEGRKTASGEIFRHSKFTAACNALPLGTWVKVTNLKNGKTVFVKINDRLHNKTRRLLDLTKSAAQKLGFIKSGLTRVKVEVLKKKPS